MVVVQRLLGLPALDRPAGLEILEFRDDFYSGLQQVELVLLEGFLDILCEYFEIVHDSGSFEFELFEVKGGAVTVLTRHHLSLEGHIICVFLLLEVLYDLQQSVILHRQSLVLRLIGLNRALEAIDGRKRNRSIE